MAPGCDRLEFSPLQGFSRSSTTSSGSPTTTSTPGCLAAACHEAAPDVIDPANAPTNIVALDLSGHRLDAAGLAAAAADNGVRISVLGPRSARLVTHLDVDSGGVKHAADVLGRLLAGG